MGSHLLRQGGEGVVVLIGEELQLEQDGAGGHGQDDHLDMQFEARNTFWCQTLIVNYCANVIKFIFTQFFKNCQQN